METVTELMGKDFDDFIKKGLVLVDFWAEWCMPCLMMAPVMEELGEKFGKKIKFAKVNIDENRKLAEKFQIRSIPNFVLFEDGKIKERFIGAMPEEEFEDKLKELI